MIIEGIDLKIIKNLYDKVTAKIILHNEKMKVFPLRSGIRQGTIPIQHSTESVSQSYKQGGKESSKLKRNFCLQMTQSYLENPKVTKKLLELINKFKKVA